MFSSTYNTINPFSSSFDQVGCISDLLCIREKDFNIVYAISVSMLDEILECFFERTTLLSGFYYPSELVMCENCAFVFFLRIVKYILLHSFVSSFIVVFNIVFCCFAFFKSSSDKSHDDNFLFVI